MAIGIVILPWAIVLCALSLVLQSAAFVSEDAVSLGGAPVGIYGKFRSGYGREEYAASLGNAPVGLYSKQRPSKFRYYPKFPAYRRPYYPVYPRPAPVYPIYPRPAPVYPVYPVYPYEDFDMVEELDRRRPRPPGPRPRPRPRPTRPPPRPIPRPRPGRPGK